MRRTVILSAIVALLIGVAMTSAAVAKQTPPRGVLTSVEYQELMATQKAEKSPHGHTVAQVAASECKSLTGVSRITSTQHAECVAAVYFFARFFGFTITLGHCEKASTVSARIRCMQNATTTLSRVLRHFFGTDAASRRAARSRGITGKCLDYLILTPAQSKPLHQLSAGLTRFTHALRSGNPLSIATVLVRLGRTFGATQKVFTGGSVTVCRHE